MWVLINAIDSLDIEQRSPTLNSVDFATLFQEKLSQIRPVLTCDSSYERGLGHAFLDS